MEGTRSREWLGGRVKPRARVLVASLVVSQIAFMVPWLVFGGLDSSPLSSAALLAAMSIVMAAGMGSLRLAALIAIPLAVASGLGVLCSDIPVLAALLVGAATFARGLLSRRGLQNALTLSVVSLVFLVAQPPSMSGSTPPAVGAGLTVLASAAWPLLLMWLARAHLPHLPRKPVDSQHAVWFAIVTSVLAAGATAVVSAADLEHVGGWFVMTILLVMQPFARDSFRRSLARGAGTALGFVLAFAVGSLVDGTTYQSQTAAAVGGIAALIAVYLILTKKRYWIYATFLTLAVVMLEGAATSIVRTDVLRLLATLAGVAVAVGITTLLVPLSRVLSRPRSDAPSRK